MALADILKKFERIAPADTLKKFGGWPVLMGEDWVGEGYQWWEQVYKMSDGGFGKTTLSTSQ